jgi:ribonuclease I
MLVDGSERIVEALGWRSWVPIGVIKYRLAEPTHVSIGSDESVTVSEDHTDEWLRRCVQINQADIVSPECKHKVCTECQVCIDVARLSWAGVLKGNRHIDIALVVCLTPSPRAKQEANADRMLRQRRRDGLTDRPVIATR